MLNVLQLKTSVFADGSVSNQLSDTLLTQLKSVPMTVHTRDFSINPPPHLDGAWLRALSTPAGDRDATQQTQVAWSDAVIAEVQAADLVVLGVPMYNFSVPSTLKAWIDHLARAGVTFRYTDQGPEGLLTGKRVIAVLSMGGVHEPGVTDHVRPWLNTVLGFVGLHDVDYVVADGLNLGPEARAQGLARAEQQIQNQVQRLQRIFTEQAA